MRITSTTVLGHHTAKKTKKRRKKSTKKTTQVVLRDNTFGEEDEALLDLTDAINLKDVIEHDQATPRRTKADRAKERRALVQDLVLEMEKMKEGLPKVKPLKLKQTKGGETLCLLFSDWHFGKVIKTSSGTTIFDSEIAKKRISEELTPKIIENIKRVGAASKIEDIQIFLIGDIVDNDIIYATQRLGIDKGVALQFHDVTRAIMEMIVHIKAEFKKLKKIDIPIKISCITGNHGRSSKESEHPTTSWDTGVYSAIDLAVQYSNLKKVQVEISLEDSMVVDVRGHRGLLVHKAPPQVETPSAKKKFGGWADIFDYDFCCFGHLHHWGAGTFNGRPILMNGSLCGYDDFALSLGVRDDWSQLMWCASAEKPVTFLQRLER